MFGCEGKEGCEVFEDLLAEEYIRASFFCPKLYSSAALHSMVLYPTYNRTRHNNNGDGEARKKGLRA